MFGKHKNIKHFFFPKYSASFPKPKMLINAPADIKEPEIRKVLDLIFYEPIRNLPIQEASVALIGPEFK